MFTKRKRVLAARFLLVLMVFQAIAPSVAKAGGGSPASNQLLDYVDPFTGDFHYSIPLLSVPGPNGENVPISLSYSAGITMDQEASWVGLGWSLNPGEITRETKGIPDDWNGVNVTRATYDNRAVFPLSTEDITMFYGPLYFKNFPQSASANDAMDIYQTDRLMRYSLFEFPDYDSYYVNGPGISGEMSPFLFDYSTLRHKPIAAHDEYTAMGDLTTSGCGQFSKNAEFLFKGELPSKVMYGKNYSNSPLNDQYNSLSSFAEPRDYTNPDNYKGTFNTYAASANHVTSSRYVEFFTNGDLNNLPAGFLDYRAIPGNAPWRGTEFPAEGIGAFRITNADGFTYHYSLPVYAYNELQRSFNLDDNTNQPFVNYISLNDKQKAYAASWKLTAITGPDYQDNGDHLAGEGDKGYWVAFDYGLWANDFPWSMPFYGYTYDELGSILPASLKASATNSLSYQKKGSVALGHKQIYYLNSIKTATHTAYFIKDQRDDAHSTKVSAGYVPKMLLKKVVLIRNEDAQSLLAPNGNDALPQNKFAGSGAGLGNVVHMGNYSAHKTAVDNASLKTIELTYDYSLCPELDNNINNTFSSSPVSISNKTAYEKIDSHTYSLSDGGKLTLKSVRQLERSYVQVLPDYVLEYARNAAYNHNKTDFWEFYKSDAMNPSEGKYTTPASSANTDKWSLTKVTTPIGSEIAVQYESDRYERVGYGSSEVSMGYPERVFILKTYFGSTCSFYDNNDANLFLNSNNNYTRIVVPSSSPCDVGLSSSCVQLLHPFGIDYSAASTLADYYKYQTFAGPLGPLSLQTNACYSDCDPGSFKYDPSYKLGYATAELSQAYGGGLRVSEISLKDPYSGTSYKNVYTYANGIATAEPDRLGVPTGTEITRSDFSNERHLLSPSVGYTDVTITPMNAANTSIGSLVYTFRNYRENFIPSIERNDHSFINRSETPASNNIKLFQNIRVDENNSLYGKVDNMKVLDKNGNIISSTVYEYGNTNTSNPNLGVIEQKFHRKISWSKGLLTNNPENYTLTSINTKRYITSYLKKIKEYKDGLAITTEFLDFDENTGAPVRIKVSDPTKGVTQTETTPAYLSNALMGPKISTPGGTSQLTPVASQVVKYGNLDVDQFSTNIKPTDLKAGDGTNSSWSYQHYYRMFDAGSGQYVTRTPSDQVQNFWAPVSSYVFNGLNPDNSLIWKLSGQNILFDYKNNRLLQQKDITRYSAVKYGYSNQYKIATVNNASYGSFAFSGFEETVQEPGSALSFFGGEVSNGEMQYKAVFPVVPHTGSYVAKVRAGTQGPSFTSKAENVTDSQSGQLYSIGLLTGRTYRASVWVHALSPADASLVAELRSSGAGGPITLSQSVRKDDAANITAGSWTLMNLDIPVSQSQLYTNAELRVYLTNLAPSSGDAYFDDLSIHPLDATISGYVYDAKTGWVTAMLDNDNFATVYSYDAAGRAIATYKETKAGIKLVNRTDYHFGRGN